MLPAKPPIVAKKSPKRISIPYSSMRNPISGQRNNISTMPVTNAAVPFHFCRRAKKTAVFCGPMMRVRPRRKSTWRPRMVRRAQHLTRKVYPYISHCQHGSVHKHHYPPNEEHPSYTSTSDCAQTCDAYRDHTYHHCSRQPPPLGSDEASANVTIGCIERSIKKL